jgi:hypothetical protein
VASHELVADVDRTASSPEPSPPEEEREVMRLRSMVAMRAEFSPEAIHAGLTHIRHRLSLTACNG